MNPVNIILGFIIMILLASCATSSSPPVTYYHLYAHTEQLTRTEQQASFLLQPVRIPEILKRQPVVSHDSDRNALILSNTHLWAGDIREMVDETLLNLLRHQLPQAEINSIASSKINQSDYKISVQLQEFFGQLNNECVLRATWQVVDQSGRTVLKLQTGLNKQIPDASYAAYVLALNQLLNEFSQIVAKELSSIQ